MTSQATSRTKGEQTRTAILDAALALAARDGLEGLTIGLIAERTGMSKSGVFAHFGSREDLQIATLRAYHERFEATVFAPALRKARGLPRLEAMFANWVEHVRSVEIPQGCIYVSGAVEFDDRPGPVRDALVEMVGAWQRALERAIEMAVQERHLRADTDAHQLIYEIYGIMLALHHEARLMRAKGSVTRAKTAFARLLDAYRAPVDDPTRRARRTT
ncbi:MAG TPA: TetR/AcrR family transcriptional regulator [Burkholderiaceae bacterium]|nr:TetR/AcrR family transcriptional regulator [Burkholderiaceae bacterium]